MQVRLLRIPQQGVGKIYIKESSTSVFKNSKGGIYLVKYIATALGWFLGANYYGKHHNIQK